MELDILKHFVNKDVEILIGGVWIEGRMTPIVKSQITLLPFTETAAFYGPTALKAENVQCIRLIKREGRDLTNKSNIPTTIPMTITPEPPAAILGGNRFVISGNKK